MTLANNTRAADSLYSIRALIDWETVRAEEAARAERTSPAPKAPTEQTLATAALDGEGKQFATTSFHYTGHAATKMVAVRCSCCGAKLKEVESVEIGIGPDCRAKYGYDSDAGPVDIEAVRASLKSAVERDSSIAAMTAEVLTVFAASGPQKAANRLVHTIAVLQVGPAVAYLTTALASLGYAAMAARIGQRLGHVEVTQEGDLLVARVPYDPMLILDLSAIPGRRVEKRTLEGKKRVFTVNIVPADQAQALWAALKTRLPTGTLVLGTKGYRVIPQRTGGV